MGIQQDLRGVRRGDGAGQACLVEIRGLILGTRFFLEADGLQVADQAGVLGEAAALHGPDPVADLDAVLLGWRRRGRLCQDGRTAHGEDHQENANHFRG